MARPARTRARIWGEEMASRGWSRMMSRSAAPGKRSRKVASAASGEPSRGTTQMRARPRIRSGSRQVAKPASASAQRMNHGSDPVSAARSAIVASV